jgi:hypothetical protein
LVEERQVSVQVIFGGVLLIVSRESSIASVVAYKAVGAKHNVILSDAVLGQIYEKWDSLKETDESRWAILRNAFSIPNSTRKQYFELKPELEAAIETELFQGRQMEDLISASTTLLSDSLPDLVTFNSSIVDQMQWERVSEVELMDGTSEAECNFLALINEFCCNAILAPIVGSQFTESNQVLATDLATLNKRHWPLAVGLPRLSPVQGLPGAALAQKRLLQKLAELFRELTHPPVKRVPDDDESVSGEETDADIATPLAKLNELFTKHDLPMYARAALALELIHSIVTEVVPLVFWTLLHIYSFPPPPESPPISTLPIQTIKSETKHWAQAIQPPSIHPSFPAPPEISFASPAQAINPASFPYLRSCINESRRLYSTSVATYRITKTLTLSEPGTTDEYSLDPSSYIDIGLSRTLLNTSPTIHPNPTSFQPNRFVDAPTPCSILSPTDASEPYKTALVVAIVAGILQLWGVSPAPKKTFFDHMQEAREEAQIAARGKTVAGEDGDAGKKKAKWVIPGAVDGSCVKVPKGDVRVRVRRVEGLLAKKVVRRL